MFRSVPRRTMRTKQLVIEEPGRIELRERDLDGELAPNEALVEAEYSAVSAGTEGSHFTGLVEEMPGDRGQYPTTTGYGHLGEVLDVGDEVTMCEPGDRVLSFSNHASLVKADAGRMALPVPEDVEGEKLVFARMAGVSISSLRSSSVQAGDTVVVIGQGLVGNFAAQLFDIAGADVMAVDISESRLERARACGIERTVNSAEEDLEDAVMEWTGGDGAHTVVEAIGKSEVIEEAVFLAKRHGEVILLGSPRARATFDVTPMLLQIHLEAIELIGSLEWRWPMHETERARDIESNYRQLVEWIADGSLTVDPLLTHVASPEECQSVYEGLTGEKDDYLGVVFDWSRLD